MGVHWQDFALALAILLWLGIGGNAAPSPSLQPCPDPSSQSDVFDFVVVGAGAGGGPLAARLAENGYSVFLVDAGNNVTGFNSTLPAYWPRATEDLATSLGYNVTEYSTPGSQVSWYPRAAALGGSTIHNAMINIIAGTRGDFDALASMFSDPSWSRDNMQNYFKKIEKNEYALLDVANHGFNGWMETTLLPDLNLLHNLDVLDPQLLSIFATLTLLSGHPTISDLNDLASDGTAGITSPSFTIDTNHIRSSVYNRLNAAKAARSNLNITLDTLVTKVLLCNGSDSLPTAYGVEIAPGAALAVSGHFQGKQNLAVRQVMARHEVILSAGVFQSPQIVRGSPRISPSSLTNISAHGILQSAQLAQFGIDTVVDAPGVGSNLQDHDEIAIAWKMKNDFVLLEGCKFLSDPTLDPCLEDWITSDHHNIYSFNPVLNAIVDKSNRDASATAPDIFTYIAPAYFEGIVHGMTQKVIDNPNGFSAIVLLTHPSSRGSVKLTGSHPQDALDIAKRHFEAPDDAGTRDLQALVLGLQRMQALVNDSPGIATFVEEQAFPPAGANLTQHVLDHIFGHHACCTNAMGADGDPQAVLDGDFQVRKTSRLRVVDLSSWANVPGYFVTTPMYMMSEKAADSLIADAKARSG
ncbi:Choline dehydrogenase [Mycena indigotica]|uniref:Choline dehydrogenase n=1 Tax=Mycena indigotica TaxID=2126181 RepID=A0A8H6S8Z2_9AGAR|nr:Choline dehydrogenase [Mycena indigotica]KAF7294577.1 Choline dehydrogenase [Mycena indigotica]